MPATKPTLRGRLGSPDRWQRLLIGLVLMALNLVGLLNDPDWLKWTALVVQIELIATAVIGWCPLYWGLGAHSCKVE